MERPRLVASDVDGTLLDPMGRVTPRTARVVRRVVASGTPFVLVTGRPPRWIPPVAEETGLTGYAVCGNGAVLYDIGADRVLVAHGLDPVLMHDVAHALERALPGMRVAAEVLDHQVGVTFSTNYGLLELSAPGITKATGLAEVCTRLNIAPRDAIAFGDMPNDVAMLRWAGHGVAMANAHPDALAAAGEITAANSEDGVAEVLERWF